MTGLSLVAVGLLSWLATFWSMPTAFLSGSAAAAGIAWINSVGNLGGHFGPDLIGRIRIATGGASEAAFYALAAVALLGAVITILLPKTQHQEVTLAWPNKYPSATHSARSASVSSTASNRARSGAMKDSLWPR